MQAWNQNQLVFIDHLIWSASSQFTDFDFSCDIDRYDHA